MAVILKKLKGKSIEKQGQGAEWEHLLTLIKVLVILFVIFSCFHWIIKKRVQHLPAQSVSAPIAAAQQPAKSVALYQVREGDTLWKIAVKLYPQKDPLSIIKQLKELNHLESDSIRPGQPLKLP